MDDYAKLGIPDSCRVNTSFKTKLLENMNVSAADKRLCRETIENCLCLYNLRPENINIPAYRDETREYLEIQVIEIRLLAERSVGRIAESVLRTIPYPTLLFLRHSNRFSCWAAHLRGNHHDSSKGFTIETPVSTPWLESGDRFLEKMAISRLRFTHFYHFYADWVDSISIFNAGLLTGE